MITQIVTPDRPSKPAGHYHNVTWMAAAYIAIIALVLYPALHEGFGVRIILWNCIPPTLGLLLIASASGKSKYYVVVAAIFASITAAVAIFFFAAWFFTSLDTDPHSLATKLVFIYAPMISLAIAALAAFVGWLVATRFPPTATIERGH